MEKQKNIHTEAAVFKLLITFILLIIVQVAIVIGAVCYVQQGDMKLEAEILQLCKEVTELKAAQ